MSCATCHKPVERPEPNISMPPLRFVHQAVSHQALEEHKGHRRILHKRSVLRGEDEIRGGPVNVGLGLEAELGVCEFIRMVGGCT